MTRPILEESETMSSVTCQASARMLRPIGVAAGFIALLMTLGITSCQAFAGDNKIKSGGALTDDRLPEQPPEGWQEYVQEKYKAYSIWLPKTGRKLSQSEGSFNIKLSDMRKLKVGSVVLACDIKDDVKLDVQRLIFVLAKGEKIDAQEAIETFRDLHMKDHPGTITEEYDLMLGKMPGKEYRVDLKDGQKSRLRVYQTGRAVWRIWVTGTQEQVMGNAAKRIFASFKNQQLLKDEKK
jgi:hypothetical protein